LLRPILDRYMVVLRPILGHRKLLLRIHGHCKVLCSQHMAQELMVVNQFSKSMVSFDLFFSLVSFKYFFYEVIAFASMRRY
jgi:hypothetical protein